MMETIRPYCVSNSLARAKMLVFATSETEAKTTFSLVSGCARIFSFAEPWDEVQKIKELTGRDYFAFCDKREITDLLELLDTKQKQLVDQIEQNEVLKNRVHDIQEDCKKAEEHIDKELIPMLEEERNIVKGSKKAYEKLKQYAEELEQTKASLESQIADKDSKIQELNAELNALEIAAQTQATHKSKKASK